MFTLCQVTTFYFLCRLNRTSSYCLPICLSVFLSFCREIIFQDATGIVLFNQETFTFPLTEVHIPVVKKLEKCVEFTPFLNALYSFARILFFCRADWKAIYCVKSSVHVSVYEFHSKLIELTQRVLSRT